MASLPFRGNPIAAAVSLALSGVIASVGAQTEDLESPVIEEVVVTGIRSSLQRAQDTKRYSAGVCLLYTSPSPRDKRQSRMPSSA